MSEHEPSPPAESASTKVKTPLLTEMAAIFVGRTPDGQIAFQIRDISGHANECMNIVRNMASLWHEYVDIGDEARDLVHKAFHQAKINQLIKNTAETMPPSQP